jgi:hypothetical protein
VGQAVRGIAGLASCDFDPVGRVIVAEAGGWGGGRWSYCFTSLMMMKLAGESSGARGPDTLSGMVHSGYLGLGWFFRKEVGSSVWPGKTDRNQPELLRWLDVRG